MPGVTSSAELASAMAAIAVFTLLAAMIVRSGATHIKIDDKRTQLARLIGKSRRSSAMGAEGWLCAVAPGYLGRRARLAGWSDPAVLWIAAYAPVIIASFTLAFIAISGPIDLRKSAFAIMAGTACTVAPHLCIDRALQRRRLAIARALPDALELLAMALRAGLGVQLALRKTTQSIATLYPELAHEFAIALADLQFLPSRQIAYRNLGARIGASGLAALAAHLSQADQSGAPIAEAVSVAAEDMRQARMAEAERRAASLPAKLAAPLVIFFMPAIFVVVLVPALLRFLGGH